MYLKNVLNIDNMLKYVSSIFLRKISEDISIILDYKLLRSRYSRYDYVLILRINMRCILEDLPGNDTY